VVKRTVDFVAKGEKEMHSGPAWQTRQQCSNGRGGKRSNNKGFGGRRRHKRKMPGAETAVKARRQKGTARQVTAPSDERGALPPGKDQIGKGATLKGEHKSEIP